MIKSEEDVKVNNQSLVWIFFSCPSLHVLISSPPPIISTYFMWHAMTCGCT